MQIVIDIPDEMIPIKQEIIDTYIHFIDGKVCEVGGYGFMVLPKGHGDLVDKDTITVEEDVYFQNYIINAPIVIPADEGE